MKVVERYPAGNLPKDLLGDDFSPDETVRVIIQTAGEPDRDALQRAVDRASEEAKRNGLTQEMLDKIVQEAREDYHRRVARR
jgi:ABC-type amino acid transport substrate-binding protein